MPRTHTRTHTVMPRTHTRTQTVMPRTHTVMPRTHAHSDRGTHTATVLSFQHNAGMVATPPAWAAGCDARKAPATAPSKLK